MVAASLTLTLGTDLMVVIAAQIVLVLLIATAGIHLSQLLHDAVPSTVRAGVSSGISTFTWTAFLPLALAFGLLTEHHGIAAGGWILVALTAAAGALLVTATRPHRRPEV